MPSKDNTGEYATPEEFTLSQSVMNMTMDMPPRVRANIEVAVKQAMENPEDFIRYVIIMLGDYRAQLDTALGALVNEGILTIQKGEPDAPSS